MKFLEAQRQHGKAQKPSLAPENKMKPGTRMDQRDPTTLISSPRRATSHAPKLDPDVTKLAKELDVDLSEVTGTGPSGSITEKDVRRAKRDTERKDDEQFGEK